MTPRFPVAIGRVYDPPDPGAGARLLIDRLWPRGLAKAKLGLDAWLKDATPSDALRKWYHADPEARRALFRQRYLGELAEHPAAVEACLRWCRAGPVLLLTAARAPEESHAPALRDLLLERLAEEG